MDQCSRCRFWRQPWGEKKDKAQCRANPPTVRASHAMSDPSGQWPSTWATDWCGRFEPTDGR